MNLNGHTSAATLAEALKGTQTSTGWKARCPAHDDRNPSLQISENGGKVLVYCHGGCKQAAVIGALKAQGLWPTFAEQRPPRAERRRAQRSKNLRSDALPEGVALPIHPGLGKPSALWVYENERPRYLVCRFELPDGKTFRPFDLESGEWKEPRITILYALPTLNARSADPVVIVGGEKCAKAMLELGFLATTVMGGEAKVGKANLEALGGRSVYAWRDADAAGDKWIEALKGAASKYGFELRVVPLPADLDEGVDVADLIDLNGWTAEEIRAQIEMARPVSTSTGSKIGLASVADSAIESEQRSKESRAPRIAFPESAWQGVLAGFRECVSAKSEVPDEFNFAAIVTLIGQLFGRRVFTHYAFPLYLNFYFLLLGRTGFKKTSAINTALRLQMDLANGANVRTLHGLSTAEGLVAQLAAEEEVRLIIIEPELRGLLKKAQNNSNGSLIPKLNDLFDAPNQVDLPTRKDPIKAQRPLVSLLSAATQESIEDAIGENEIFGGFLNRVIPIAGTPKAPQPWPEPPDHRSWAALVHDLDSLLSRYPSETRLQIDDPTARSMWETFYVDFHKRQLEAPELLAALSYRLHTHVQKFALLYAVLRGARSIEAEDMAQALEIARYVDAVIDDTLRPLGLSRAGRLESKIEHLLTMKAMKRRELSQKLSGRVKAHELRQTIDNLINLERIEQLDGGILAWNGAPYLERLRNGSRPEASTDSQDGAPEC